MSEIHVRALWRGFLMAVLSMPMAGAWAVPSLQFSVSGDVNSPAVYDEAQLKALPAVTQTVSYLSGGGSQTHTYIGPTLWNVLNTAGIQTNPAFSNDILNKYVVAKGSDGYQVVISMGEIHPNFGNQPDLIVHSAIVNGNIVSIGADGFARITAPGDIRGGRYVSNLVDLFVADSASIRTPTGPRIPSTQFTISGDVLQNKIFDLEALQALPSFTVATGGGSYTGVSLWDLLNLSAGLDIDSTYKNDVLNMYVVATGSDGYKTLFSLGEINPDFGDDPIMVAYALDGELLTTNGFARVVAPGDVRNGRYVSNLVSLEVFHAERIPEPQTLALLMSAGLALAWVRRRNS